MSSRKTDLVPNSSIFVIRAFVRLHEQIAANQAILKRLPLLQPPPDSPRQRIGFQSKRKA